MRDSPFSSWSNSSDAGRQLFMQIQKSSPTQIVWISYIHLEKLKVPITAICHKFLKDSKICTNISVLLNLQNSCDIQFISQA